MYICRHTHTRIHIYIYIHIRTQAHTYCATGTAAGVPCLRFLHSYIGTNTQTHRYNGYFATLLRNAPGAMLKFGIYEQIKRLTASIKKRQLNPTVSS